MHECFGPDRIVNGDIGSFFEEIAALGLDDAASLNRLPQMTVAQQIGLVRKLREKMPAPTFDIKTDPFSFIANGSLSGTAHSLPSPFSQSAMDSMARFASLYATRVYIHDPFPMDWLGDEAKWHGDGEKLAEILISKLSTILYLRPLLERGIVQIIYNSFPIDALKQLVDQLERFLTGARAAIYEHYAARVKFNVSHIPKSGFTMSLASGASDIVGDHEVVGRISTRKLPPAAARRVTSDMVQATVTMGHPWFDDLFAELLGTTINDLAFGATSAKAFRLTYLTNHKAEAVAFDGKLGSAPHDLNKDFFSKIKHEIPIVGVLPISTLLRLRDKEAESFAVYRDAVRAAIKEGQSNPDKGHDIFDDLIKPELNKLDLAVVRNRKTVLRDVARETFFSAGVVGVGMCAGLVTPGLGNAIAAIGGLKFTSDLMKSAKSAFDDPPQVRENQFYFLWKLGRRKHIG